MLQHKLFFVILACLVLVGYIATKTRRDTQEEKDPSLLENFLLSYILKKCGNECPTRAHSLLEAGYWNDALEISWAYIEIYEHDCSIPEIIEMQNVARLSLFQLNEYNNERLEENVAPAEKEKILKQRERYLAALTYLFGNQC